MQIMAREEGVDFSLDDDIISELATYGVIKKGLTECVKSSIRFISTVL